MATYIPVTDIPTQFFDADGAPEDGGSLEFYLAGTDTATDLFSDDEGTSIGTSIALNSLGYPESGGNLIGLFRDQSKALKIVLKDSDSATVLTMDDIPAVASFDATSSAKLDYITVTQAVDLDTMESDISTAYQKDGSVALTADLTMPAAKFINESVTAGVVASVTQTQAGGTALVSGVNEVATVASANDAVTLPAAVAGRSVKVFNNAANILQVFPASGDSIDAGADDASTTQSGEQNVAYTCIDGTTWESSAYTEPSEASAYGIMSVQAGSTAETTTDGTARKLENFDTDGIESNLVVDSTTDNDITASIAGTYFVSLQLSFSGTANSTFVCEIHKNGVATGFSLTRKLGTGGDVGSASCSGLISLAATDTVEVYHRSTDGGTAFTMVDAQLVVEKVAS